MDQTREISRLIERLERLAAQSPYPDERNAAQAKIDELLVKYACVEEPAPVPRDTRDATIIILVDNLADISNPTPPPNPFYWW